MTKDTQPHAFVLICCESGPNTNNLDALRAIPEVIEAHAVYGVYDEMVRVKTESMQQFKQINAKIRALPSVRSTITMFIE